MTEPTEEERQKAIQAILKRQEYDRQHYQANKEEKREHDLQRYQANKEKEKERSRRYRQEHPDYVHQYYLENQEKKRQYHENNKEECNERSRQYHEIHKEEVHEQHHQRHIERREEIHEQHRLWYQTNRVELLEKACRYQKEHPEVMRNASRKRRALKAGADGNFTEEEFQFLCEAFENKCIYCGQELPLTADHATPLVKGGSNDISNIVPACKSCNDRKGTKTGDEFVVQLIAENARGPDEVVGK